MSDFGLNVGTQDFSWYTPTNQPPPGQNVPGRYDAPPMGNFDTFEEEAPLLEELGIDLPGILKKSKAILFFQLSSPALEDLDMGGPLLVAVILGALHLVMGKLHFGVILGWSVVAACILAFVVNQLAGDGNPDSHKLVLYSCCCLLGYCLLPIVLLSILKLFIPGKNTFHYSAAVLCVIWSTYMAAGLFIRRSICLEDMRRIVRLTIYLGLCSPLWIVLCLQTKGILHLFALFVELTVLDTLLGVYMLAALCYGMLTFRTVPEEADRLRKDIDEARADLIARGILDS